MFDPPSFLRVVAFAVIFGGIEYRYVNRREAQWTREVPGFDEKPVFWLYAPYHFYFLLPLLIVVSFTPSVSAWAGNVFYAALAEDVAYFVWRGKTVMRGEWTTQLFGSFQLGKVTVPAWWPLDALIVTAFYLLPFV
ncbi:MAG: hypothetical protein OK422_02470 [Thaumarchaeota archaeon]|nr:hypothetical protein [Nitrososphaerota archaeon]